MSKIERAVAVVYAARKTTYAKFRYLSRASAFLHEEAISFPANHFNLATTITVIVNRNEYTPANSSASCNPLGKMLSVYNDVIDIFHKKRE